MAEKLYVLIVDDDEPFGTALRDYLVHEGLQATHVVDGAATWQHIRTHPLDVLILDLNLRGENGLDLLQQLRAEGYLQPVLMLSASGDDESRINGLESGVDDYLGKPANSKELLARVKALARRIPTSASHPEDKIHKFGPYRFNATNHALSKNRKEVELTNAEATLLTAFTAHPNIILTRARLTTLLKGYSHERFDRTIDVSVRRLRCKIEDDPSTPRYIRTVRGQGYMFSPSGKVSGKDK